jgi:23S rRNA (uracil1939-C5)-methyltransferase/tRNA (uracil-5-)-methyltransferase
VIFSRGAPTEQTKYTEARRINFVFVDGSVCFVWFVAKPGKFNNHPFAYHQEIELEIATLTNLGVGLGRVPLAELKAENLKLEAPAPAGAGWVVMVPFALPGERVRARVFRNHQNYSEADLVEVQTPSPHRVAPRCPLFGRCGGCQYQNLAYAEQLRWKQRQVRELLEHLAGIESVVAPVIASPRVFGYRSKITPHFETPAGRARPLGAPIPDGRPGGPSLPVFPIGFLRQGSRHEIIDVPRCEIATEAINQALVDIRTDVCSRLKAGEFKRGATLLLRQAVEGVVTDYDAVITEDIPLHSPVSGIQNPKSLRLRFLARDFFQNNPFILPAFAGYVRDEAAASDARFLIDAYCGSGLFALAAAPSFVRVTGVEISATSIAFAAENAAANGITNARFVAGDAAAIFAGVDFPPGETVVVIDPPRKGCDESFLQQLFAFGPRVVVYVSCDPATQMRDLRRFLAAGYALTAVQPFDLFPQTRHLECVITLRKTG